MNLEERLSVNESLLARALMEATQHITESRPEPGDSVLLYTARAIHSWMQANFAQTPSSPAHPNEIMKSKRPITSQDVLPHKLDASQAGERYRANSLGMAVFYTILADRFGVNAYVAFMDGQVPQLHPPSKLPCDRLYAVFVAGYSKATFVLPQYVNGFDVKIRRNATIFGYDFDLGAKKITLKEMLPGVAAEQAGWDVAAKIFSTTIPRQNAVAELVNAHTLQHSDPEASALCYERALKELGGEDVPTLKAYAGMLESANIPIGGQVNSSEYLRRKEQEVKSRAMAAALRNPLWLPAAQAWVAKT